jgi:hypothetical protein
VSWSTTAQDGAPARRDDWSTFKKWQLSVNVANATIDLIVIDRN